MKITSSSGLTEEETQRLIRDDSSDVDVTDEEFRVSSRLLVLSSNNASKGAIDLVLVYS